MESSRGTSEDETIEERVRLRTELVCAKLFWGCRGGDREAAEAKIEAMMREDVRAGKRWSWT